MIMIHYCQLSNFECETLEFCFTCWYLSQRRQDGRGGKGEVLLLSRWPSKPFLQWFVLRSIFWLLTYKLMVNDENWKLSIQSSATSFLDVILLLVNVTDLPANCRKQKENHFTMSNCFYTVYCRYLKFTDIHGQKPNLWICTSIMHYVNPFNSCIYIKQYKLGQQTIDHSIITDPRSKLKVSIGLIHKRTI